MAIDGIYGNFPGCIMNGGRLIGNSEKRYSREQIEKTYDRIACAGQGILPVLPDPAGVPRRAGQDYFQGA